MYYFDPSKLYVYVAHFSNKELLLLFFIYGIQFLMSNFLIFTLYLYLVI